jgi:predicted kinase
MVVADGPPAGEPGRLIVICGLPGAGKTTEARRLVARHPGAKRMCPDEWMDVAAISQWDAEVRSLIESAQWRITQLLLRRGDTVVIEWGTWGRDERDALRVGARSIGATVELIWLDVAADELWRRISARTQEDPPPTTAHVDRWVASFEAPSADELAAYDAVTHIRA